jgi:oligopeptide transport system permease protein
MRNFFFQVARAYLAVLILILFVGVFLSGQGLEQNVDAILLPASFSHWFGTDSLGRDVFWRVVQGGQVSVLIGVLTALLSLLISAVYGGIAGWYEGNTDCVLMRGVDILLAIPSFITVSVLCLGLRLILPITNVALLSFASLTIAISATHWMGLARILRGLVMETKRRPFIEASRALGASTPRIFHAHIFPNIRSRVLVLVVMQIPTNIMYESLMSFIGLGVQSPWTSWGLLVRDGWKNLSSFPHLILFPSLVLFVTMWSFNVVFDRESSRD